ncbi:MAG: CYTH domain-containing protein [Bacteroidales bacterium]|nr:CYTH domain-containing protein [Bacteroidales bacterium]
MPHREIERKFLVKGDFKAKVTRSMHIVQGYLCTAPEPTVRVRIRDNEAFLTIKGLSEGPGRFEWEKPISVEDARELLRLAKPGTIDKVRHLVPSEDGIHTWEVDEFHGANEGLIMAEIELSAPDETFPIPDWIGKEVTSDPRFYNSSLRKLPYSEFKNTIIL